MLLKQKYPLVVLLLWCLTAFGLIEFTKPSKTQIGSEIIGTNLSAINYYSSEFPFLDEFKSSNLWVTQAQGIWNTNEVDLLDLDSHGWVKSLPNNQAQTQYTEVGTLLFREHSSHLPGKYVVLYEGEGTIEYGFDGQKITELSTPGRDIVEIEQPSKQGMVLSIITTDPQQTGNYIRNIRVIPEAYESIASQETFNPHFLAKIQPFGTLRFMDWQETNNSVQQEWSDRPKPEDVRYFVQGVPLEIMVQLANQTNSNPWFTMPHQASDEYITKFANYVQDNLKPGLKVYVEYSNETWNWRFDQTKWIDQQSQQQWLESPLNKTDWYSQRTTETIRIWDEAFGKDGDRVIGVMAGQAANVEVLRQALKYQWSDVSLSHQDTGIDAIAIAPYFGGHLGSPDNQAEILAWTQATDGGLDQLFQELTEGGLLSDSPVGGTLAQTYRHITTHAELAQQEGLQLLAYEAGQHLAAKGGVENNEAIMNLFIAANRDRRMGLIYRQYLTEWFNLGGDLLVHFNDVSTPGKWGSWGALESIYQTGSPKYDAIMESIETLRLPPEKKS